jgi:PucR family transcriptional regulator, proline-responsive transcriptional activator
MRLTLNIILEELTRFNPIVKPGVDYSQSFQDIRLYTGTTRNEYCLYVCDTQTLPTETELTECIICSEVNEESACNDAIFIMIEKSCSKLEVFEAIQDIFLRYSQWNDAMNASLLANKGIQDLLDLSTSFTLNNIVVLDPALKLLGYTKDVPCDDPITNELIAHGYHTSANIQRFKLHHRFEPWATEDGWIINKTYKICKYITVVKALKISSCCSVLSVMMCNNARPDDALLDIYQILLDKIAYYVKKDYSKNKPSGNLVDAFIIDLIEDTFDKESSIIERSDYAGIPYKGTFCLFCIQQSSTASLPVERALTDLGLKIAPAKVVLHKDEIIILCFDNCRNSCPQLCDGLCTKERNNITRRVIEVLRQDDLVCGRSSKFYSLDKTYEAYIQANRMCLLPLTREQIRIEKQESTRLCESPRLFNFDDHLLEYLLWNCSEQETSAVKTSGYCRMLLKLLDYDKQYGTNNFYFLYNYLLKERRPSIVADSFHMHRNNVAYRIERIQSMLTVDFELSSVREGLKLAYKILEVTENITLSEEISE